jgi:hypothetical protein
MKVNKAREFVPIDPMVRFNAPHTVPWVRIATDEAKAAGTFVHIGDCLDHGETVLTYEVAQQLHEWLGRALGTRPRISMTGLQVQHIADFIDGDPETEVYVAHYEAGKDEETGEEMPAGLYCWLVDYPDEGRVWLPPDADAALSQGEPGTGEGK